MIMGRDAQEANNKIPTQMLSLMFDPSKINSTYIDLDELRTFVQRSKRFRATTPNKCVLVFSELSGPILGLEKKDNNQAFVQ